MSVKKARIIFFSFLILLTGSLGFFPGYNGDLPFYIATAMIFEGKTDQQAISDAKAVLQSEIKGEKLAVFFYNLNHTNPNILNNYRIKPLYVILIVLLHRLGLSYITSTLIPSWISFFLIGILVFYWSSQKFKPVAALVISIILMLITPSIILARLSTPDALSNLFILICFYRIYFGKNYYWTALFLFLSLLIRLDNFISTGIML